LISINKSEHNHNIKGQEIEEINLVNQKNIEDIDNESVVETEEYDQNDTITSAERPSNTV
jgi:hypothetical protein